MQMGYGEVHTIAVFMITVYGYAPLSKYHVTVISILDCYSFSSQENKCTMMTWFNELPARSYAYQVLRNLPVPARRSFLFSQKVSKYCGFCAC